jgi:hypothetical protein
MGLCGWAPIGPSSRVVADARACREYVNQRCAPIARRVVGRREDDSACTSGSRPWAGFRGGMGRNRDGRGCGSRSSGPDADQRDRDSRRRRRCLGRRLLGASVGGGANRRRGVGDNAKYVRRAVYRASDHSRERGARFTADHGGVYRPERPGQCVNNGQRGVTQHRDRRGAVDRGCLRPASRRWSARAERPPSSCLSTSSLPSTRALADGPSVLVNGNVAPDTQC